MILLAIVNPCNNNAAYIIREVGDEKITPFTDKYAGIAKAKELISTSPTLLGELILENSLYVDPSVDADGDVLCLGVIDINTDAPFSLLADKVMHNYKLLYKKDFYFHQLNKTCEAMED
jgi:hypothetical protein